MAESDPPPSATPPDQAAYGWQSDLPTFYGTQPRVVRLRLEEFIRDAGTEQIRAWDASIPWLQRECRELADAYDAARTYTAILEYELPRESRRPDVITLAGSRRTGPGRNERPWPAARLCLESSDR